ncbi:MAG: hypothetical protein R3F43_01790 [bacterium]
MAALPGVQLSGQIDLATGGISLTGFEETWGLAPGASLRPSRRGRRVEAAGLFDQDEDGDPGVTVPGNGASPTAAWLAQRTTASIALRVAGPRAMTRPDDLSARRDHPGGRPPARCAARSGRAPRGSARAGRWPRRQPAPRRQRRRAVQCVELAAWIREPAATPARVALPASAIVEKTSIFSVGCRLDGRPG